MRSRPLSGAERAARWRERRRDSRCRGSWELPFDVLHGMAMRDVFPITALNLDEGRVIDHDAVNEGIARDLLNRHGE